MISNIWQKSTRSAPNCDNCVEVKTADDGGVQVRDSKLGDASPVLTFSSDDWSRFLREIRDGFANPMGGMIETWPEGAGKIVLNRSDTTVRLTFTGGEWGAFTEGVLLGEFDLQAA